MLTPAPSRSPAGPAGAGLTALQAPKLTPAQPAALPLSFPFQSLSLRRAMTHIHPTLCTGTSTLIEQLHLRHVGSTRVSPSPPPLTSSLISLGPRPGLSRGGTCSFSMGRVTLYMSMVLMMMAGVVRKKKRKKRKVLIAKKRTHQLKRRMDRCFLGRGEGGRCI